MDDTAGHAHLSRRTFLRTISGAAGLLAAAPLLGASAGAAAHSAPGSTLLTGRALRVGVLLAQPPSYPEIGANFLAGMQLYLAQHGGQAGMRAVELLVRESGVLPDRALTEMRALLEPAQADLLVGMMRSGIASSLHPAMEAQQVPLIVGGAGANLTRQADGRAYIFRNTLGAWRGSWALGNWAARNLGSTALIATSFYDSGYDANYLFELGFEGAGGTVIGTRVSHRPTDRPGHLGALMRAIQQAQPTVVFAGYAGQAATEFVRAYATAGLHGRIPLLGAGFLADERHLQELGEAAVGIRTALPWAPSLDTSANRDFKQAFRASTGRPADAFAVLGYDTAQLIAAASRVTGGDSGALRQALASAAFAGPRGPVAMDSYALDVSTPLYLREVQGTGGHLHNAVVGELFAPPQLDARFQAVRATTKTDWQNAYLCV
ncbi:hypothetical protein SE17_14770 [Kouleothrix aurantiaca]|uniref:Leucine-binding protein domain-containing protein n=1 Tax=Kouleothrix aurantiaca TaxID=186479 RepID=A0A0P9D3H9_9CHLR|nr:hypothetical protein SE17_14770 [Kouleothrix aurantiaca]